MNERQAIIEYVLAQGWDDDDVVALELALNTGLEEVLGLFGERYCPVVEYCEMAGLLLEWHRDKSTRAHSC